MRRKEKRQLVACDGKVSHASRRAANYALKCTLRKKTEISRPGFRLRVYKCQYCGAWHIGHEMKNLKGW